jgi:hypothetical protein
MYTQRKKVPSIAIPFLSLDPEPLPTTAPAAPMSKRAPGPSSDEPSVREVEGDETEERDEDELEQKWKAGIRRKVDLRLCGVAGVLCSLNLLDSGVR